MLLKWTGKFALCLATLSLLMAAPASAQDKADATGPAKVKLAGDLGTLDLPAGYVWLDQAKARQAMEQAGGTGDNVIGFIAPQQGAVEYAIVLKYEDTGYVEDKDAGKIDAKAILESYQEGTEANNEERKKKGMEAIHVTGWEQEPSYDPKKHVVVWSLQGENDKKEKFVNYNTRVLTRKGVLSVNLMCDNADLPKVKPNSQEIVQKLSFKSGETYEDHKEGDKISPGGIMMLVAGGALLAKKTGVLAFLFVMAKPLLLGIKALGGKFLLLIGAGIAYVGKAIFGSKNKSAE